MKFRSLLVQNFKSIQSAQVVFGEGLNVLYGPNDLGKSTLAQAIRAVLLMQPSASEADSLASWTGCERPVVSLVFELGEATYRVKKTFEKGQHKATLEKSYDGVAFEPEAKGREVDAQLRTLLGWGLAPPGKGSQRGLPSTFISTALLAEQGSVDALFAQKLSDDHDSAAKTLTDALQAMATDPLFRSVFEATQKKTAEAYTEKGKLKRGQGSPLAQLRERLNERQAELLSLEEKLRESEGLQDEAARLEGAHTKARIELDRLDALGLEKAAARAARRAWELAAEQLRVAKERLDTLDAATQAVEQGQRELETQRAASVEANLDVQLAEQAEREAGEQLRALTQQLERLQREDSTESDKQALEHRRVLLEQAIAELTRTLDASQDLKRRLSAAQSQRQDLVQLRESLDAQLALAEVQKGHELEHARRREELEQAKRWLDAVERRAELQRLSARRAELQSKLDEAAQLEAAAALRLAGLRSLPTAKEAAALRKLWGDLRVAEASLEVGLAVTARPQRPIDVRVVPDAKQKNARAKAVARSIDSPTTWTAAGELLFEIDDLVEIHVQAGSAEARQTAETLRDRWQAEAVPVLESAEVPDLDALDAAIRQAQEARREAENQQARARELRAECGGSGELDAQLDAARAALALCCEALQIQPDDPRLTGAGESRAALERALRELDEAARRLAEAVRTREHTTLKLEAELRSRSEAFAALEADLAERAKALGPNWEADLPTLETQRTEARAALQQVLAARAALEGQRSEALDAAQRAVDQAAQALAALTQRRVQLQESAVALRDRVARLEGQLESQRQHLGLLDRASIVATHHSAQQALPTPTPPPVDEDDDDALQRERLVQELARISTRNTELAVLLQQSDGRSLADARDEAQLEVEEFETQSDDLELDYEAWKLLRDTLLETESQAADHLGRALAPAIGERFDSLTQARYGALQLGQGLDAQGIFKEGESRGLDELSIGTREQLATVMRIALAERLKSVLMLDDQLVQSDVSRTRMIGEMLRNAAETIQVIVLTCRPEDYEVEKAGPLHAVDLAAVIS